MRAPLPNTQDRETRAFFEAAGQGRLVYRACNSCNRGLHPPSAHCPRCGSSDTAWREAAGVGKVHTWTVVTHAIHPAFPAPYTLVVVALDDAPEVRLMGRLDGAVGVNAGTPMRVWFEPIEGGGALPQWRLAE